MNQTPMKTVIYLVGATLLLSLAGLIALTFTGVAVPDILGNIISGAVAGLLALLANPRSGADTRTTDTRIPIDAVESIEVAKGGK